MWHVLSGWLGARGRRPPSPLYAIPEGQRVYAVGDIHGLDALLADLLERITADIADAPSHVTLLFIGDYIDRGPASKQVLERLGNLNFPANVATVFLRGNHEQALLEFLADPVARPDWLGWGGEETLASYGIRLHAPDGRLRTPAALAAELDEALAANNHKVFLQSTKLLHRQGDYLFVHAGVRPSVPLHRQLESDLLFIREGFVGRPHGLPCRVVYGHTMVAEPLVLPDRIAIDTGAYTGGPLTAAVLEEEDVRFLQVQGG
ncbi:MAG: metallophosphoesterase [Pseudomonadaceae bacterium]|nr:metallophosphoesterase [Pseudomonadaceae bacterium]